LEEAKEHTLSESNHESKRTFLLKESIEVLLVLLKVKDKSTNIPSSILIIMHCHVKESHLSIYNNLECFFNVAFVCSTLDY